MERKQLSIFKVRDSISAFVIFTCVSDRYFPSVELEIENAEAELAASSSKRDLQDHMRILWSRMNVPGDVLYAGEFDQ